MTKFMSGAAQPVYIVPHNIDESEIIGNVDIASISDNTILGKTDGAKVITDADGTLQQYLRGLVSMMADITPSQTTDAGPAQTLTRTYTTSADMTTAAALTVAPASGQKIVAVDLLISTDTAMLFDIEMETSANVLAAVRLPANGSAQISLRGYLKGDAADKKLYGKASVAGNVYITAVYFSEA